MSGSTTGFISLSELAALAADGAVSLTDTIPTDEIPVIEETAGKFHVRADEIVIVDRSTPTATVRSQKKLGAPRVLVEDRATSERTTVNKSPASDTKTHTLPVVLFEDPNFPEIIRDSLQNFTRGAFEGVLEETLVEGVRGAEILTGFRGHESAVRDLQIEFLRQVTPQQHAAQRKVPPHNISRQEKTRRAPDKILEDGIQHSTQNFRMSGKSAVFSGKALGSKRRTNTPGIQVAVNPPLAGSRSAIDRCATDGASGKVIYDAPRTGDRNPKQPTRKERAKVNTATLSRLDDQVLKVVHGELGGNKVRIYYFIDAKGRSTFAGIDEPHLQGNAIAVPWSVPDLRPGALWSERIQVFGLGQLGGGETAYHLPLPEDMLAHAGRRLLELLKLELFEGPLQAADSKYLALFNMELQSLGYGRTIDGEDWNNFIRASLNLAMRKTAIFDGADLLSLDQITKSAAGVLGIGSELYAAWEAYLDVDITRALVHDDGHRGFSDFIPIGITGHLLQALDAALNESMLLNAAKKSVWPSLSSVQESEMGWEFARISSAAGAEMKVREAFESVKDLCDAGRKDAAARLMALIVNHSDVGGREQLNVPFIPLWSRAEVASLVKSVISAGMWYLASTRLFREGLAVRANRFVNRLIQEAHLEAAWAQLRKVDVVKEGWEGLLEVMDRTGQVDALFDVALTRMFDGRRRLSGSEIN